VPTWVIPYTSFEEASHDVPLLWGAAGIINVTRQYLPEQPFREEVTVELRDNYFPTPEVAEILAKGRLTSIRRDIYLPGRAGPFDVGLSNLRVYSTARELGHPVEQAINSTYFMGSSIAASPQGDTPPMISLEAIRGMMDLLGMRDPQTQQRQNPQQTQAQQVSQQTQHTQTPVQAQPDRTIAQYGTPITPRRVTMPLFEIQSNPQFNLSDIRNRRFDIIDRTAQGIMEEEDRRIFEAIDDPTVPQNKPSPPKAPKKKPPEEVIVRRSRLERVLDDKDPWD
jgi:hypothetical protein